MTAIKPSPARIRIYAAGGTGVNVASTYNGGVQSVGTALLLTSYIDTSLSNMRPSFAPEDIFHIEDLDGSGKQRDLNVEAIKKYIKPILLQMRPEDLNIVVFSASGGSGSVIGPLLMRELLSRGHQAIAVVAGSEESAKTAENTLNTLKSLVGISKGLQLPVIAYYDHNTASKTRSEVDRSLRHAISSLSYLASKQNRELDSQDLINWMRFDVSTSTPPQLALLDIYNNAETIGEIHDPISIASLYQNPDQPALTIVPDYHCAGYTDVDLDLFQELHFVISTEFLPNIFDKVSSVVTNLAERRDARVAAAPLLSKHDTVTDDGLVL